MYFNPVKVIESNNWQDKCLQCQEELGIRNPIIVTSKGNSNRLNLPSIFNSGSIFSAIKPNPTFESCQAGVDFCHDKQFDGIVAIGGGSVMDTAKVSMTALGTSLQTVEELLVVDFPFPHQVPAIFIPTTHGTGSEVTMWGTIWNTEEKKKYSISHTDLYPKVAILDGALTLGLPLDISLITVLDALSHGFEAIWNKNANPQSTDYAIEAICIILKNVGRLKADPQSIEVRKNLLRAANLAGLAFSNTKTAAAHSISYPLTINYGIPHGITSSLPLIPLLQINKVAIDKVLDLIIEKSGSNNFLELLDRIKQVPGNLLKFNLNSWGVAQYDLNILVNQSFTNGRMDNNIVDLTEITVRRILEDIY